LPELRKGKIGLVVATQIARYVDVGNSLPGWHSPEQAWAQTQGQLAWYKAMEEAGEMIQITNLPDLEKHCNYGWIAQDWDAEKTNWIYPEPGGSGFPGQSFLFGKSL